MITVRQRQRIKGTRSRTGRLLSGQSLLSALSIFTGIVHLLLAGPHFEEAAWLGTVFLLDGVALMGAGVWLLTTDSGRAMRAASAIAVLTAFAYVTSRTIGLPGMDPEAWDALGLVTTVAEVAIVISWPFIDGFEREAQMTSGLTSKGRRDA